jgi:hypothetical protein
VTPTQPPSVLELDQTVAIRLVYYCTVLYCTVLELDQTVAIRFAAAVWVKCPGPKPPNVPSFRPTHHPPPGWALPIVEENRSPTGGSLPPPRPDTTHPFPPPASNFPRFTLPFPVPLSLSLVPASPSYPAHTHRFSHTQQLPPSPISSTSNRFHERIRNPGTGISLLSLPLRPSI